MISQPWTVIHIVAIIPILLAISRSRVRASSEVRVARRYFNLTLVSVAAWLLADFAEANATAQQPLAAVLIIRFGFVAVSFVVFFFALSSIHLTRIPHTWERLLIGSPLILILVTNLLDPFEVTFVHYGWFGDISNDSAKYLWLGSILMAMTYSLVQLMSIRSKISDAKLRKRVSLFEASVLSALSTGFFFYLLSQFVNVPILSSVSVSVSIIPAFFAFAPLKPYTHNG